MSRMLTEDEHQFIANFDHKGFEFFVANYTPLDLTRAGDSGFLSAYLEQASYVQGDPLAIARYAHLSWERRAHANDVDTRRYWLELEIATDLAYALGYGYRVGLAAQPATLTYDVEDLATAQWEYGGGEAVESECTSDEEAEKLWAVIDARLTHAAACWSR